MSTLRYAIVIMITCITITCIVLVELLLLLKLFELKGVTIPLITAIIIFGILLFMAPRQILNIKFKYPLSDLEHRTDQLNDNIKNLNDNIKDNIKNLNDNIKILVMASMSDEMYMQLKNIAKCDSDKRSTEMKESIRRELTNLDVLGYIKFTERSLTKLKNGDIFDMNKKAEVTDLGKDYIALRDSFK